MVGIDTLRRAAGNGDWEQFGKILDSSFARISLQSQHELLQEFAVADPQWLSQNPRHLLERELAKYAVPIDSAALQQYRDWTRLRQDVPLRDQMLILQAELRQLTFTGAFDAAAERAQRSERIVAESLDVEGITDFAPLALIECGMAYLLNNQLQRAIGVFHDARRWALLTRHPALAFAEEMTVLTRGLQTGSIPALPRKLSSDLPHPAEATRMLQQIRLLVNGTRALATVDGDALNESLAALGLAGPSPNVDALAELWWLGVHLLARRALVFGDRKERTRACMWLRTKLEENASRTHAHSAAGWLLRADLADLQQSVGALEQAQQSLQELPDDRGSSAVVVSQVRLFWLRGAKDEARSLAREVNQFDSLNSIALDLVRYCLATESGAWEHAEMLREFATASLVKSGQWFALVNVPMRFRGPFADMNPIAMTVADPFRSQTRAVLTPREREVLLALRPEDTVKSLAARFYVSQETMKSHLRSVYRKIGARSRRDAMLYRQSFLHTDSLHSSIRRQDSEAGPEDSRSRGPESGNFVADVDDIEMSTG